MTAKRIRAFRRAAELLDKVIDRLHLTESLREHRVFGIWDEAVGPQVAAHAQPERISKGILRVRVDHNTWLQQLTYMKAVLLTELNSRLGDRAIRDLDLRMGRLEKPPRAERVPPAGGSTVSAPPSSARRASPEAAARMRAEVARIADPELRETLERLWKGSVDDR